MQRSIWSEVVSDELIPIWLISWSLINWGNIDLLRVVFSRTGFSDWKEFEIYQKATKQTLNLKEYRHNLPIERAKVVNAVKVAWDQVQGLAVPVDLQVNDATTSAALQRFQSQCLDGYDLLILEAISRSDPGQIKVITDDSDYVTVPGIQVFTYNQSAIAAASNSRKLIVRWTT